MKLSFPLGSPVTLKDAARIPSGGVFFCAHVSFSPATRPPKACLRPTGRPRRRPPVHRRRAQRRHARHQGRQGPDSTHPPDLRRGPPPRRQARRISRRLRRLCQRPDARWQALHPEKRRHVRRVGWIAEFEAKSPQDAPTTAPATQTAPAATLTAACDIHVQIAQKAPAASLAEGCDICVSGARRTVWLASVTRARLESLSADLAASPDLVALIQQALVAAELRGRFEVADDLGLTRGA